MRDYGYNVNRRTNNKCLHLFVVTVIMICGMLIGIIHSVHAEKNIEKTEQVVGTVYQFKEKENYDLPNAEEYSSTESGTKTGGEFSIVGNISSVSEKNGFPTYSVNGGNLTFSYVYDDSLLNASEDEEHLVDDNGKKVSGKTLDSDIKKGVLIVQTSKDGKIWFNIPEQTYIDVFKDNPDGLREFYTTTNVQTVNGCYYRILIAYKTGIRTQKAQKFPPKREKHEYKKYEEVYCFYAYDETTINTSVPEDNNRCNLGEKARTKNEGYIENEDTTMNNKDPHFGWDIGQFFIGGYTDYEEGTDTIPIFLKNNGDKISLWFELQQDIDKCYGKNEIRVVADHEAYDAELEVPGGVNETIDFGRGALILRKTNPDNQEEDPQIYTNYLEASASTDAITKVDLLEEGDYEVALDYALKFDKTKIFGKSILPETAKYRVSFSFKVRNGNSMAFLFDKETGSELSSGSITENGFKINFANSKYLRVNVKREILKDGYEGLTEDTRFNSVAADGDEFTDEGVYTLTITNRDFENVDPTVKRVYVGSNNILKAYMVNNIPISEIKEMIALGATITDNGTIIPPEPDSDSTVDTNSKEAAEKSESSAEVEDIDEAADTQSVEESVPDSLDQNETEVDSKKTENITEEQTAHKNAGLPIIPISIAAVTAVVGGFFLMNRRKK